MVFLSKRLRICLGLQWKQLAGELSCTTYVRECQSMMIYQMRLQLDEAVSVLHNFPNCGIRKMKGFLLGQGIRVQWNRVRSSLWRTDPSGIQLGTSQLNITSRRHYSVPESRSLRHLDVNHKLIRWGFVIYGCLDGYSRRIMFWIAALTRQPRYYSYS